MLETRQAAFTNDVFRTPTRKHGTFFIKFHTARWYLDLDDTACVVDRELAGYELLGKRGIRLPYLMWGDCSRLAVPRSVLISGELAGTPAPVAMRQQPGAAAHIAEALGRYLARLHAIEFTNRCPLARLHALAAPPAGRIPHLNPFRHTPHDPSEQDPCGQTQEDALADLAAAKQRGLVTSDGFEALAQEFAAMAEVLAPALESPRFILQNCHAVHFHTQPVDGQWTITGVYDFEAVAADDPTLDLLEIEIGLTKDTHNFDWRAPFERGYGPLPGFYRYKLRLLRALLYHAVEHTRSGRFADIVPDLPWLAEQWPRLAQTGNWNELQWYPG